MTAPRNKPRWYRWLSIVITVTVCLSILAGSVVAVVVINRTEPTAQQINATRKSSALVETVTVKRGTYSPQITVLGTVRPAREVILSPRVRGQVVDLAMEFLPGGMVGEGEELLKIDPADFLNEVSVRESELEQAEASLEVEEGRQSLARKELALLKDTIDETNQALVLRKPQLASIQAEVDAAKAALAKAKLDLERTRIVAPFDAQILSCSVNVGSQVSPGDELARIVGRDDYWVIAAIPVRSLQWVQFPDAKHPGSTVRLRNPGVWPPDAERIGTVSRMIGTLDNETRLARVLITVSDPLARNTEGPPLILDTLIETHITGRPIDEVVRLDREYVRDGDTVWLMEDGKLKIQQTVVLYRDAEHAYISGGLKTGDEVVTSTLATVADGINLRKIESADESSSETTSPDSESVN